METSEIPNVHIAIGAPRVEWLRLRISIPSRHCHHLSFIKQAYNTSSVPKTSFVVLQTDCESRLGRRCFRQSETKNHNSLFPPLSTTRPESPLTCSTLIPTSLALSHTAPKMLLHRLIIPRAAIAASPVLRPRISGYNGIQSLFQDLSSYQQRFPISSGSRKRSNRKFNNMLPPHKQPKVKPKSTSKRISDPIPETVKTPLLDPTPKPTQAPKPLPQRKPKSKPETKPKPKPDRGRGRPGDWERGQSGSRLDSREV